MDYVLHPLEPLAFRLTLAGPIERSTCRPWPPSSDGQFPSTGRRRRITIGPGFYVGAHVDDSWSSDQRQRDQHRDRRRRSLPATAVHRIWHGGIQVGYDYMMPSRVVLGIEGDVSSGGSKATTITDASGTSANETNVFDSETVRVRLGYAFDNVLLYGTGGWAWSSNQYIRTQLTGTLNIATAGTDEAVNKYLGGWTAGGGVAFAFAQNWNAFAEYRHTSFGSSTMTLPFSQLSTTFEDRRERDRFRRELQVQLGRHRQPASRRWRSSHKLHAAPTPALVYKAPGSVLDLRLDRLLYRRSTAAMVGRIRTEP